MDGAKSVRLRLVFLQRPFLTSSSLGGLQECEAPPVTTHEGRAVRQEA